MSHIEINIPDCNLQMFDYVKPLGYNKNESIMVLVSFQLWNCIKDYAKLSLTLEFPVSVVN